MDGEHRLCVYSSHRCTLSLMSMGHTVLCAAVDCCTQMVFPVHSNESVAVLAAHTLAVFPIHINHDARLCKSRFMSWKLLHSSLA